MDVKQLKNTIANAAIRCFSQKGYEEVSVQDICQEAGIVRSTFYRTFSGKKEIFRFLMENTDTNRIVGMEELLAAENDFERLWIIGDRYITIVRQLGPSVLAAMNIMEMEGELDLFEMAHSVDKWFIRLTRNCQKTGIIRSNMPPEELGPMFADLVYHQVYTWVILNGKMPLRARCRKVTEMVADVAPEFRWTEEQMNLALQDLD